MPKRIGLHLAEWPASDRAAWARATNVSDYFDEAATAAEWRPKTRASAVGAFGRWLAFVQGHCSSMLLQPLEARASPHAIHDYTTVLAARVRATSVAAELNHLVLAFSAMAPHLDWRWLRRIQSVWQRRVQRRDLRPRMVHPSRLRNLGVELMESADASGKTIAAARKFRDGLLIALLACRPLRRRTLCALRIGHHLRHEGERYVLYIPGSDLKSGVPAEFELPEDVGQFVTRYLTVHRPAFPNADQTAALWISSKGGALSHQAIYQSVFRRTRGAFGFGINLHLFRHIAATTVAREAPGSVSIARDLLGHVKLETTTSYYVQAKTLEASQVHASILSGLRSRSSSDRK